MPSVLVIGEALIDVVQRPNGEIKNIPGGSPANTAVALSRLGTKTFMKARISADKFGVEVRNYLINEKIDLKYSRIVPEPSSVINAFIQPDGSAKYEANLKGSSDYGWTQEELNQDISRDIEIIQLGSLTSYIEPGASHIEKWFESLRKLKKYLLIFDPNIRHPLDGQTETEVRMRAKKLASFAHVVKASDEDLNWIFPTLDPKNAAIEIIKSGASLVVITKGKNGAIAIDKQKKSTHIDSVNIEVKDTIGAGDTFGASLITQLLESNILTESALENLNQEQLSQILNNCALTAAITCSRQGANPPFRNEVSW
ncbi:MAG: hypothetical protein RIS18_317 [Actinomycetota bacterium]